MAERSFNYDTAVGRVFRAAFLSLLPFLITKPGNSHLSPIAQPSVNHSIPSPPSDISLTIFFLSRHRLGEEEKIERQLLIRKRQPPDNWSPSPSHRLETRSLLSLSLSKILHLIAPCNNYPRGHRRCVNHERELSHRGGWERERERFTLSLSGGKETVKSLCERWIMGRSFSRFPRRGDVCSWIGWNAVGR